MKITFLKTIIFIGCVIALNLFSKSLFGQICSDPVNIGAATVGDNFSCDPLGFCFEITNYNKNPNDTYYVVDYGDGSELDTLKQDELDNSGVHSLCHDYKEISCENTENGYQFSINAYRPCTPEGRVASNASAGPVTIGKPPVTKFDIIPNPSCINNEISFINNTETGYDRFCTDATEFIWNFGDGTTSDQENPTHSYKTPGNYTVTLEAKNGCAGTFQAKQTIRIEDVPRPIFEIGNEANLKRIEDCQPQNFQPQNICVPVTIPLKSLSAGNGLKEQWTVSPTNGATFSTGSATSTQESETITITKPGTYEVRLTASNSCGENFSCVKVTVFDKNLSDNIIIEGISNDLCVPASLDLNTNVANATSFSWTINGINGTVNPAPPANADTNDPDPILLPEGEYEIILEVANTCGATEKKEIIKIAKPIDPEISPAKPEMCPDKSVTLEVGNNGGQTFQWFFEGEEITNATNFNYDATKPGNYHVVVKEGNCHITSSPVRVNLKPTPIAKITPPQKTVFCVGDPISAELIANSGNNLFYQWRLDGVAIPGADKVTLEATIAGKYTVLVTENECSAISDPITISIANLPTVEINGDSQICVGQNSTLTATGASMFTWEPAEGLTTGTGNEVIVNPMNNTTYTVTGVDDNGCENKASFEVIVNPLPDVNLSISENQICAGNRTIISASGALTYTWSPATGLDQTTGDKVVASPLVTTTYTVFGRSGANCESKKTITVEVKPLPNVEIFDTLICIPNSPISLVANPKVSGKGRWEAPGLPAGSLTPDGVFDPMIAGENIDGHEVKYIFIEDGPEPKCENIFIRKVKVYDPTPKFTPPPDLICVNSSVFFENTTFEIPGDPLHYLWKFDDGSTYTTKSVTHIFSDTADVFGIWLYATSKSGCVDSIYHETSVSIPPFAQFSMENTPTNNCGPLKVKLTNKSIGKKASFIWKLNGVEFSRDVDPDPLNLQPGFFNDTTYYISLQAGNTLCGGTEFLDSVVVKPKVKANFIFEKDTICADYPLKLFNFSIGEPEDFYWGFGDGSTLHTTDTGFVEHTFENNTADNIIYYIKLKAESSCNPDEIVKPLVVIPKAIQSFFQVNTDKGCAPLSVDFTSNQVGRSSLNWIWGDGDVTTGGLKQTHTYDNPGKYIAQLVVVSGCHIDTFPREITVLPSPEVSFTTQDYVCDGGAFTFLNTSPESFGNSWDFGDGTGFTGKNPPPKKYDVPGFYKISLTITNPINQCHATFSKTIEVKAFPKTKFEPSSKTVCQGQSVVLNNLSLGGESFMWVFDHEKVPLTTLETSPEWTFDSPGIHKVRLISFTDNGLKGCSDTLETTINVLPTPLPFFEIDTTYHCGVWSVTLTNVTTFPEDQTEGALTWDLGKGDPPINGFMEQINEEYITPIQGSKTYNIKLTAKTKQGCEVSYTYPLVLEECCGPKVFFPENGSNLAFTPFNGGKNNEFRLKHEYLDEFDLRIYDKWDKMVFQSTDPDKGWNGYYNGKKCLPGPYKGIVKYGGCKLGQKIEPNPKAFILLLID